MIQAVIFDCYGVLVIDALEAMVQSIRRVDPAAAEHIAAMIAAANKGIIAPDSYIQEIVAALHISRAQFDEEITRGVVKNNQLLSYITELRQNYRTGLLSNISAVGLACHFSEAELSSYFDAVVTSGAIGTTKPNPRAYEYTASKLNALPGQCLFIDDRAEYCQGAERVGMRSILYRDFDNLRTELDRLLQYTHA